MLRVLTALSEEAQTAGTEVSCPPPNTQPHAWLHIFVQIMLNAERNRSAPRTSMGDSRLAKTSEKVSGVLSAAHGI